MDNWKEVPQTAPPSTGDSPSSSAGGAQDSVSPSHNSATCHQLCSYLARTASRRPHLRHHPSWHWYVQAFFYLSQSPDTLNVGKLVSSTVLRALMNWHVPPIVARSFRFGLQVPPSVDQVIITVNPIAKLIIFYKMFDI